MPHPEYNGPAVKRVNHGQPLKNRVAEDVLLEVKEMAEEFWLLEIEIAKKLHEMTPDPSLLLEVENQKKLQLLQNLKRKQYEIINMIAKMISGAIHPQTNNTYEEKNLARELVAKTRKELEQKGILKKNKELDGKDASNEGESGTGKEPVQKT